MNEVEEMIELAFLDFQSGAEHKASAMVIHPKTFKKGFKKMFKELGLGWSKKKKYTYRGIEVIRSKDVSKRTVLIIGDYGQNVH